MTLPPQTMERPARSLLWPFVFYSVILATLSTHRDLSLSAQIIFLAYAFFIFLIVWNHAIDFRVSDAEHAIHLTFIRHLFFFSFIFFALTRFFLFFRYGEAPLGYDTGFYIESMRDVLGGVVGHRMSRALLWTPFLWLGIPRVFLLHGLYVLFQFLLFGSFYTFVKTLSRSARAMDVVVAMTLFVVSVPQFFAFWWIFYQMELAIALLFVTLALLFRRNVLALLTGILGASIHPSTFFPLAVALVLFLVIRIFMAVFLRKRFDAWERFLLVTTTALLLFVRYVGGGFITTYLDASTVTYGWFYTNYPEYQQAQFTGLFFDFSVFRLATLFLLPFAVLGVLLFVKRQLIKQESEIFSRFIFFFFFSIIILLFSYFPFIYQHRFLIILDFVLIVFATYPMTLFFQYFFSDRWGRFAIGVLLFGLFLFNGYIVWNQQPMVYPDELKEIKAIATIARLGEYAMATESVYTPWVFAFSGRTTIDPGYLSANFWDQNMWEEFWKGESNARRHELLRMYTLPIYIFIGNKAVAPRYKEFITTDPYFTQISPHVWRYDPRSVPMQYIIAMRQRENELSTMEE